MHSGCESDLRRSAVGVCGCRASFVRDRRQTRPSPTIHPPGRQRRRHRRQRHRRWCTRCLFCRGGGTRSSRHEKSQRLPPPSHSSTSSGRTLNPTKPLPPHSPKLASTGIPTRMRRTMSHVSFVGKTLVTGRKTTTLMSSITTDVGNRVHGLSRGVVFSRWIRTLA